MKRRKTAPQPIPEEGFTIGDLFWFAVKTVIFIVIITHLFPIIFSQYGKI